MSKIYIENGSYIVELEGYDGSSITNMRVAEASAPNTWYTFGSVALEAPNPSYDGAYIGTHDHKFVGFGANEAAWAGNNFIIFTPTGLADGQSITTDSLLLPSDWSYLINQTGFVATDVKSELVYHLKGHWSFDNGDATADVGDDGTNSGATFVTDAGRSFASFDGNDSISIPHDDNHGFGGDYVSVSAWVKTTSTQNNTIWLKAYGSGGGDSLFTLEINNGQANKARLFWRNSAAAGSGTCFSTSDINDGEWHHIVAVRSGSDLHLYVDGALESSASGLSGNFTANLFYLGKWGHQSYGDQNFYVGSTDDFRVYSMALDASQVDALYNSTTVSPPAPPIQKNGYYPLYENETDANGHAGGNGTSHSHEFGGVTYYMPNGLTLGVDQFHGTYGLEGHWSFDNGDATADVGSDGTNSGATFVTVDGRTVAAFEHGDYIQVDNAGANFTTEDFTAAFWFYNHGASGVFGNLIGNLDTGSYGWGVTRYWDSDTLFTVQSGNGGSWSNPSHPSQFTIPLNTWTHVVLVRSGTQFKIYLDGVDSGYTTTAHAAIAYTGDFLRIATHAYSSNETGIGKYDDVRIYSRAMDADEVAYWYAETTVSADPTVSLDQDPSSVSFGDTLTATVDLQGGTLGYFAFEYYDSSTSSWVGVGSTGSAQYDLEVTADLSEKTMKISMEVDSQWYFSSQWTMPTIAAPLSPSTTGNYYASTDAGTIEFVNIQSNADGITAGATQWAYSLYPLGDVGQAHGGTAVDFGNLTLSGLPESSSLTLYYGLIDASGLVIWKSTLAENTLEKVAHTLTLWDSYGDGWDGTYLEVYDSSGATVYSVTRPVASSDLDGDGDIDYDDGKYGYVLSVNLPVGDYTWALVGGSWPNEHSFTFVRDSDSFSVAASTASNPSSGSFFVEAYVAPPSSDLTPTVEILGGITSLSSQISLPATFTINVWVRDTYLDGTRPYSNLFQQVSGAAYVLDAASGIIGSHPERLTFDAAAPLRVADTWHMVSVTYDGTDYEYFANGSSIGSVTPSNPATVIDNLNSGVNANEEFAAYVKDLRIYEGVRSSQEILDSYGTQGVIVVSESSESSSGTYDWTHGGQLTNIVKFSRGVDALGNPSFAYAKKEDDNTTTLYLTTDIQDFAQFSSNATGATGIVGSPVCMEYGPGKLFMGTSTGNAYEIEFNGNTITSVLELHVMTGGESVREAKYDSIQNQWIFEAGERIFTVVPGTTTAVERYVLPSGAKCMDIAPGDSGVAIIIKKADHSLSPIIATAGWTEISDEAAMVASLNSLGVADFNYDYVMDKWIAASADGQILQADDLLQFLGSTGSPPLPG